MSIHAAGVAGVFGVLAGSIPLETLAADPANADASCGPVEITAPRGVVADAQPLIEWSPLPNAIGYRLELESRVAESRTLVKLDTPVAGTTFRAPQRLTDHRARVSLRITPTCAQGLPGSAQTTVFDIDTSPACRLSRDSVRSDAGARSLSWDAVPGADAYRVSIFGADGVLLAHTEVPRARFELPKLEAPASTVVIKPHCPTGWGELVYLPAPAT